MMSYKIKITAINDREQQVTLSLNTAHNGKGGTQHEKIL